ncbi:MAG: DUF805 domain-containing protein [Janthinobacterium lividum]
MSFAEAIKSGFNHYATFSGRARRSEYWFWTLFTVLVAIVASVLDRTFGSTYANDTTGVVGTVTSLALLVPGLAMFWRRMHDINRSGAWLFCLLIPVAQFVFAIIFIVWACKQSQPEANRFGAPPKAALYR